MTIDDSQLTGIMFPLIFCAIFPGNRNSTSTTTTYLGFPLTASHGIDSDALAHRNALAAQRASSIIFKFKEARCTSVSLLRRLYLTYVRPCFFYGSQIAGYTQERLRLMQLVENRLQRAILSCPPSTATDAMAYLLRIPHINDQVDFLSDSWARRVAMLPPAHPTRASCETSTAVKRGRGLKILSRGLDLADKPKPKSPKDNPTYWSDLASSSTSSALRALIVLLPPASTHFKLILSLGGSAGHAIRLWLLHRLHPDPLLRSNPPFQEAPPFILQALRDLAEELGFTLPSVGVRVQGITLDPVSFMIYRILHKAKPQRRSPLLLQLGTLLREWRDLLS